MHFLHNNSVYETESYPKTGILILWKKKSDYQPGLPNCRLPLIIKGARQTGKTWACLDFGKQFYRNTAYFDMEASGDIRAVFERDLDPGRIIRELSALSSQSIFEHDTLIIFDEIQACERALTSLKYFCEKAPVYHIIAAGSLLGVSLNREKFSFPVGKAEMLVLYPLDFGEFLAATENEQISCLIKECYAEAAPFSLHEKALDLYRQYLVVGGMPQGLSLILREVNIDKERNIASSLYCRTVR